MTNLLKIAAYMLKYMVLMEINRPEVQINEPESYSQKDIQISHTL